MSTQALTVSNPGELLKFLQKSRSAIGMALPKHLNPDRMMRLALTSFSTTPALRQCTPTSILASIIVASQLGLEPGIAGQGYLIPYKGQCTFVPGWQGLVGLLNNTGRATAWTGAVFEGDTWVFELGSAPKCQHVPGPNYGDTDKLQWVYACGKVNGSEQPVIEAWPISRVWKHRDKFNKVGSRHYSFANEEMYARKVVLLQVLKYMPRSIELNNAIAASDAAEMGNATRVESGVIVEIAPEEGDVPQFIKTATRLPDDADQVPGAEVPPTAAKPAPAASSDPSPARHLREVRGLLKLAGFTDLHLLNLWRTEGVVDESLNSLEEVAELKLSVLRAACEPWNKTLAALKSANAQA